MSRVQIEIWSDVVCPWCYIGKRRFEEGLAQFKEANPEVEVEVAYRSFQLDPTASPGISEPVVEAYAKKFGGPDKAKEILDRVTAEAAGEGIEFNMDIAKRSNTLLAHRLLVLAEQKGLQLELKERLMQGYFTEGVALGEPDELVAMAVDVGLDEDEARDWLDNGNGRDEVDDHLTFAANAGISGVPTYVFNRESGVSGAQSAEVFTQVLEQVAAQ